MKLDNDNVPSLSMICSCFKWTFTKESFIELFIFLLLQHGNYGFSVMVKNKTLWVLSWDISLSLVKAYETIIFEYTWCPCFLEGPEGKRYSAHLPTQLSEQNPNCSDTLSRLGNIKISYCMIQFKWFVCLSGYASVFSYVVVGKIGV